MPDPFKASLIKTPAFLSSPNRGRHHGLTLHKRQESNLRDPENLGIIPFLRYRHILWANQGAR